MLLSIGRWFTASAFLAASAASAQTIGPVQEAAVAASLLLRERLPRGTQFVIVPDTTGDRSIAAYVGATLGIEVKSADEGRSCHGAIPQCSWRLDDGAIAVRILPVTVTSDSVVLDVEHWRLTRRKIPGSTIPRALMYAQDRVLVVRQANRWSVVRITPEFTT